MEDTNKAISSLSAENESAPVSASPSKLLCLDPLVLKQTNK